MLQFLVCIFNIKFLSFHPVQNIFVDAMHDWEEGVLKYDVPLILAHQIKDLKLFTDSFLNERLNAFDFDKNNNQSRPATIDINSRSASEALIFIRILPLLIGDMIARDNEHWNLLIILRSISEIIFSKSVHKNITTFLALLIEEYFSITFCFLFCVKR